MEYISDKEYNSRMKKIKFQNENEEKLRRLKEEKNKNKKKRKLPSASKLILIGVVFLCLEIVIFCEYAMLKLCDTSAMYALIAVPTALVPTIWGYYSKSKAENTSGGIVYEMAMAQLNNESTSTDCTEDSTVTSDDTEMHG